MHLLPIRRRRVAAPTGVSPSVLSATVPAAGTSISILHNQSVTFGAGGNGGFALTMTGGAVVLTYQSGAGTATLVYTLSRTLSAGETGSLNYTQPGNGVEASSGGLDLTTFANLTAVNNSTQASPTHTTSTISTSGAQITLGFSGVVNVGAGGNGGFVLSMSGGASAMSYVSGSGSSSLVYSLARAIDIGESGTLAYTQPGNGIEGSVSGLDVASFSGHAVTNNSTQRPALTSAVIGSLGTSISLAFSKSVTVGAGGNGGVALTMTGGAVTAAYSSGSGSTTLTYTLNRTINSGETGTIAYTQPGNGLEATASGADVATFSGSAVTNNSSAGGGIDRLSIGWEQATPEQIGIYAPTTAAVAAGSTVTVRYKASSSGTWLQAHPLLRISTTGNESGGPTTIVDAFAGSIFDLQPGTSYDVELTHVEAGQANKVSTFSGGTARTTRALPAAAAVTGTGTTRTANSVATIGTQFGLVNPGDVLTIADGTYDVSSLTLSRSGTAANPIYIRGTTRAGTILRDTTGTVLLLSASYVVLENLTIQGSGVDTGNTSPVSYGIGLNGARINVTIRNVTIFGVDQGIMSNDGSETVGTLIYNCSIQGNDAWISGNVQGTSPTGNDTGVELPGLGNCCWSSTIKGFGDGFSFVRYSSDGARSIGSYAYRNELRNCCDDATELDYGTRNIAFYDNLVVNCGTSMSLSYVFGGPAYCFRNVAVNVARGPYKINGDAVGQTGFLIYNNTIVRTDGSTGGWGMTQTGTNGEWNNYSFRNNLLVYRGSATGGLAALEQPGNNPCDFDYNAWFPNSGIWWTNSGGSWGNLAAAKTGLASATRTPLFGSSQRMQHDVITVTNPFTNAITLGASHTTEITGKPDATLSASGPKNLGVAIPGITDGFTGAAPDIGAIITGRTAVTYGDVSASQPAWMSGMALFTWKQLTNTRPSAAGATDNMTAFSGCVLDPVRRNLIPWGGGHNDSPDNAVYAIRYGRDVPDVVVLNSKSSSTPDNVAHNPDGKPSARHSYDLLVYRPLADEFFSVTCPSPWHAGSGNPYIDCDGFRLSDNTWWPAKHYSDFPNVVGGDFDRAACVDSAGIVYAIINNDHSLQKWTPATNAWTELWGGGNDIFGGALVFDPVRSRLVLFANSANGGAWWTLAGARTGLSLASNAQGKSVVYCPERDSFLNMQNTGGAPNLFEINPTTYAATQITLSGTPPAPTDGTTFYSRFQIDTTLGILLLLPGDHTKDAYAMRYR